MIDPRFAPLAAALLRVFPGAYKLKQERAERAPEWVAA